MTGAGAGLLSQEQGAVARLVIDRAGEGNSLSLGLVAAMRAQLAALAPREDIKVIVITGAGGRIFSAGHDLKEFTGEPDMQMLCDDFAGIAALMQQIVDQPQIVIARVEGVATAAGCELVAACDLALAADTARFAVPGVNIGFWCHTPQVLLSRAVGRKHAMMMLATGKLFPAEHALAIGLVNSLHPVEQLDAAIDAVATSISSKPASVLRAGKASFSRQADMALCDAYGFVQQQALANIVHPDAREGIAAFLEKRAPDWLS
ncbi:MAG: enoyl-CoA hydratase/isomerase family protein [Sphingomonadales bacterium]|nr:enoyl-CoA hydratase/isomerase family protein [Sphingomonadales bacterium]MBD3772593.1 enoyl-CoA hydratase/isomerase family protein [Paracoccaceae bacterium]